MIARAAVGRVASLALCLVLIAWGLRCDAAAPPPAQLFEQATQQLQRGAFEEALAQFEQLSDRGVVDANASFNRALAYLARAESPARRPGDLGQAVAALRETLVLSAGDDEARRLLEHARRQIARERARRGRDPLFAEPPLGRAISKLLSENTWAWLALLASLGLTVALLLRRWPARSPQRLAGNIASVSCALVLTASAGMTGWAAHLRNTEAEAVVVVEQATLLDATGAPVRGQRAGGASNALAEGASVFVTERQGRLSHVHAANVEAWVLTQQLRALPAAR